jgi:hypothetical protein
MGSFCGRLSFSEWVSLLSRISMACRRHASQFRGHCRSHASIFARESSQTSCSCSTPYGGFTSSLAHHLVSSYGFTVALSILISSSWPAPLQVSSPGPLWSLRTGPAAASLRASSFRPVD